MNRTLGPCMRCKRNVQSVDPHRQWDRWTYEHLDCQQAATRMDESVQKRAESAKRNKRRGKRMRRG